MASTGLPQRGHDDVALETRVGGTSPAAPAEDPPADTAPAVATPAGDGATGFGAPPEGLGVYAGPTRAADGLSGFPQSMQKREAASLSRPQKAQRVTREPPCGKSACGANIGRARMVGQ